MKNIQNKKKIQIMIFVLIAVVTLGVGYAAITAINLVINGNATGTFNQENFKVKFTTAAVTTGTGTAAIDTNDPKVATFDVTGLTKVGDTAVASYTVLNDSPGIGASIDLAVTNSNTEYFSVTETIEDNKLQAGDTTTATVTVQMIKTPITSDVTTSITGTLTASPLENNSAAGGTAAVATPVPDPVSFSTDSWATIQKAVQDNNTSVYNVGDTKEVSINNTNYTVRLVNKTTGEHCGDNDTAYSQTACGFVVEFVDIVEQRVMNSESTNIGGWPGSELYTYLQGTFYNNLPNDLKSSIKPTRVISGYGSNGTDSANFTSTDNLYLLSGVEVFGSDSYDTAASTTTRLEYYVGKTSVVVYRKKYNGSNAWYWLRPAHSNGNDIFRIVRNDGGLDTYRAYTTGGGLAPAFRIG